MSKLLLSPLFALVCASCDGPGAAPDPMSDPPPVRNVVLVHGGFVDGGGWEPLYHELEAQGFNVSVVQNTTVTLADDVAATKSVLAAQDGPTILVGHSYGGAVITEAGNDPAVVGLVYLCAFAPDTGESVQSLIGQFPADGPQPPILPPEDGFLHLDKSKFHEAFAGDLSDARAAFLADSQLPWGVEALGGIIGESAWRSKPAWYLVTTADKMIPPSAQRMMAERTGATVSEIAASHAVYESQPKRVADLIEEAARSAH